MDKTYLWLYNFNLLIYFIHSFELSNLMNLNCVHSTLFQLIEININENLALDSGYI